MEVILILVLLSIVSGAIAGMGGSSAFIPIVGLISLTSLTQTEVSGTIAASFFIATFFGSLLYTKSGDQNKNILIMIIPPGIIGSQIGVYLNGIISEQAFTILTATVAIVLGLILVNSSLSDQREKSYNFSINTVKGKIIIIVLGVFVGIVAGITGIGGIPIVVPTLLILNIDHMTSIATGFTVATFNTLGTSLSYLSKGAVQFEYIVYIGVPFAVAQIVGWKFARNININGLKISLGVFNIILGIYLGSSI
jgi:uncharacterized membrane protein YfcA